MDAINRKALAVRNMVGNVEGIKCILLIEALRQLCFRTKRQRKSSNDREEYEEGEFRPLTRSASVFAG